MEKIRRQNRGTRGTYKHALKIVDLCEKLYNQGRAADSSRDQAFADVKDRVFAEVMDILKLPAKSRAQTKIFDMKKTQFSRIKKH